MTDDPTPAGPAHDGPAHDGPAHDGPAPNSLAHDGPASAPVPHARFEFLPAADGGPATVRAVGDIDLTNVGQFQAALDQAAAAGAVIADMTAVTYCDSATIRALFIAARQARLIIQAGTAGPITEALLKVSGLDQVATVVTLDNARDPEGRRGRSS